MVWVAENVQACLRIFRRAQHQWLVRDILHLPQGVFTVFVLHPVSASRFVLIVVERIQGTGRFILVYRLAIDAKTRKGDGGAGGKYPSLLEDFQTGTASMARKRHLASSARGFYGFCLTSRWRFKKFKRFKGFKPFLLFLSYTSSI